MKSYYNADKGKMVWEISAWYEKTALVIGYIIGGLWSVGFTLGALKYIFN